MLSLQGRCTCDLPEDPLPRQNTCSCLKAQPNFSHRSWGPQPILTSRLPGRPWDVAACPSVLTMSLQQKGCVS